MCGTLQALQHGTNLNLHMSTPYFVLEATFFEGSLLSYVQITTHPPFFSQNHSFLLLNFLQILGRPSNFSENPAILSHITHLFQLKLQKRSKNAQISPTFPGIACSPAIIASNSAALTLPAASGAAGRAPRRAQELQLQLCWSWKPFLGQNGIDIVGD